MQIRDDAWVIADTHFGHKHIIDYADRPFKDVSEMDQEMIARWNSVVSDSDWVLHLGDFSLASPLIIKSYFSLLKGSKILLLGNHDRAHTADFWLRVGFREVIERPFIYKDYFIVSHEPVDWVSARLPVMNIHGHIHEKTHYNLENNHYNVSVENINYTPVRLQDIIEKGYRYAAE